MADLGPSSGEGMFTRSKQWPNDNAASRRSAAPPMAADRQGFEPPTEKTAVDITTVKDIQTYVTSMGARHAR